MASVPLVLHRRSIAGKKVGMVRVIEEI